MEVHLSSIYLTWSSCCFIRGARVLDSVFFQARGVFPCSRIGLGGWWQVLSLDRWICLASWVVCWEPSLVVPVCSSPGGLGLDDGLVVLAPVVLNGLRVLAIGTGVSGLVVDNGGCPGGHVVPEVLAMGVFAPVI